MPCQNWEDFFSFIIEQVMFLNTAFKRIFMQLEKLIKYAKVDIKIDTFMYGSI